MYVLTTEGKKERGEKVIKDKVVKMSFKLMAMKIEEQAFIVVVHATWVTTGM